MRTPLCSGLRRRILICVFLRCYRPPVKFKRNSSIEAHEVEDKQFLWFIKICFKFDDTEPQFDENWKIIVTTRNLNDGGKSFSSLSTFQFY